MAESGLAWQQLRGARNPSTLTMEELQRETKWCVKEIQELDKWKTHYQSSRSIPGTPNSGWKKEWQVQGCESNKELYQQHLTDCLAKLQEEKAFLQAIDDLLAKADTIRRKLAHCVITGPTGAGKSSLLKRLLQKHLEKFLKSTGISESMVFVDVNEINPTTFHSATAIDSDLWEEVDYEVSLVCQMGQKTVLPATQSLASSVTLTAAPAMRKAKVKKKQATSKASSQPYQVTDHQKSFEPLPSDSVHSVMKKYCFQTFKEYLKKTSSLYLRDTGGQVEFQEMMPLLIFGPSIFLFVFRADLDFQSALCFQYRESEDRSINCYTSSITTEQALLQCLASVYAMDTSGKADVIKTHKSLVFIIGTHIDQLGSSADNKIKHLNQHIDSVIKKNGFRDLVQYCDESNGSIIFPVDNTSDSDRSFQVIRSKVNRLVSHCEEFSIEYPTSFLIFCLDLQKVKRAIISLNEFRDLAAQHGITEEQVFTLLYFLHLRVGVVRWFNVDGLRDIVVLKPQVLFNTITMLIVRTFSCKVLPSRDILEYKERGVLSDSAFESVVKCCSEDEMKRGIVPTSAFETIHIDGDLSPKKFLQLLVQLRIVAPFLTAGDQVKKYFIPCVLNHVPEANQGDYPHTDVLPLAIKFHCQHCPKGIFGVLVTHLMTLDPGKVRTIFVLKQDKIYKDQVFFTTSFAGDRDTISLKAYSSHMEIQFFPGSLKDRDEPVSVVCQEVRKIIAECIDKSIEDLHYSQEKLKPSMCFSCTQKGCCKLHSVFKGKEFYKIHCDKNGRTSRLPPQGRCWFSEGEQYCEALPAVPTPGNDQPVLASKGPFLTSGDHNKFCCALEQLHTSAMPGSPVTVPDRASSRHSDANLQKDTLKEDKPLNKGQAKKCSTTARVSVPVSLHPPGLTKKDHFAITRHLEDLLSKDIINLGLALGLYYPHLENMRNPLHGMVAAWLNREDNVLSASGEPSWTSLIKALRVIGQSGVAQEIEEDTETLSSSRD